jgi:Domain of unknown function DUF488
MADHSMTANRCSGGSCALSRLTAWAPVCRPTYDGVVIAPAIWTIGHSNHPLGHVLDLLDREQIAHVVDVRSYPYSRVAPHFNREGLAVALSSRDMGYLFLGRELGGRPDDPAHYDAQGHALYGPMSEHAEFRGAVKRVYDGAPEHRIALLCSEADPTHCHRRLLVGKVLADRGVELRHILADGGTSVEQTVDVPAGRPAQCSLLDEDTPWRSTRSVSQRARLSTSSVG